MNIKDGKIHNILIEDTATGFTVWADPGMKNIISSVPGVSWCSNRNPTEYIVFLDHRYDIEWIKQEITAQIIVAS